MNHIGSFSSSQRLIPAVRNIDAAAPDEMRQGLVDAIFSISERVSPTFERKIYEVATQSMGLAISGNPFAGYRYAVGRDIRRVDWVKVYDLIVRLWPEFKGQGQNDEYRENVNAVLAVNGIAWELDSDGSLVRVLPVAAQNQVAAAIHELSQPRFSAASSLFNSARDAYDDRPRRDRDACANAFDAMESVAKVIFNLPNATFGNVLGHIRSTNALSSEIVSILDGINTLRNRKFGHGMQTPFDLSSSEVDFTFLSCIGGILLFARRP